MTHILHIDSSARVDGSVTRQLTHKVVGKFQGTSTYRDLGLALPQINDTWLAANWTAADERDSVQTDRLALSDALIAELQNADTIVIGVPLYNFGVPASLKAWIDLICRNGQTFNYTPDGPKGRLTGKRAILVMASGGVPLNSEADFATGYMRQVLKFIGIEDVQIIAADQVAKNGGDAINAAHTQIAALAD